MIKQIIFHKYQGSANGFLIYDIRKNDAEVNEELFHVIKNRNFGIDLDGILVGPYVQNGHLQMKLYDGQGREIIGKSEGKRVREQYLQDAGYLSGEETKVRTEKIYCWC